MQPTRVIPLDTAEFSARVTLREDGTAELYWTDGVANDWREDYASHGLAILRLAALVEGTKDPETPLTFNAGSRMFSRMGRAFFASVMS